MCKRGNKSKYCNYCCNATVEPELNSDNDFSYMSVGKTVGKHLMYIRSGNNLPTAIIVSEWDNKIQRNVDIGTYVMKYCPECGRKLIENRRAENATD